MESLGSKKSMTGSVRNSASKPLPTVPQKQPPPPPISEGTNQFIILIIR